MSINRYDEKADKAIREAMQSVKDNMTDGKYRTLVYDKLVEALLLVHASDIV